MKAWIDTISLAGSTLRVTAPEPLPADRETLLVASAIRVFERFPALDGLVLAGGDGEVSVTRASVERFLQPEGFTGLQDRGRWPKILARAIQRYGGADGANGT
jgi:hypothetical protein